MLVHAGWCWFLGSLSWSQQRQTVGDSVRTKRSWLFFAIFLHGSRRSAEVGMFESKRPPSWWCLRGRWLLLRVHSSSGAREVVQRCSDALRCHGNEESHGSSPSWEMKIIGKSWKLSMNGGSTWFNMVQQYSALRFPSKVMECEQPLNRSQQHSFRLGRSWENPKMDSSRADLNGDWNVAFMCERLSLNKSFYPQTVLPPSGQLETPVLSSGQSSWYQQQRHLLDWKGAVMEGGEPHGCFNGCFVGSKMAVSWFVYDSLSPFIRVSDSSSLFSYSNFDVWIACILTFLQKIHVIPRTSWGWQYEWVHGQFPDRHRFVGSSGADNLDPTSTILLCKCE